MTGFPQYGQQMSHDPSGQSYSSDRNTPFNPRFKSEAPIGDQLRNLSNASIDDRRRLAAFQGRAFDYRENEQERADPRYLPPQRLQRVEENHVCRSIAAEANEENNHRDQQAPPSIVDIFANFRPSEPPRAKAEPRATNLADIPQHKSTSGKTGSKKKRSVDRDTFRTDTADAANSEQATPRSVIDLTVEEQKTDRQREQSMRPPESRVPNVPSRQSSALPQERPQGMTPNQLQSMNQAYVPLHILLQARQHYQEDQIILPLTIKTWAQFKHFVAQHPDSDLTPEICAHAQAEAFRQSLSNPNSHSTQQHRWRDTITAHSDTLQADIRPTDNTPSRKLHSASAIAHLPSSTQSTRYQAPVRTLDATRSSDGHNSQASRGLMQPPPSVSGTRSARVPLRPIDTVAQIQRAMLPSNAVPDLLPADAPEGHPRLVNVWEPFLLQLPRDQHEHLNLLDTVVSVIYRYDSRTKAAIRAFLDTNTAKHFFFLFKARTNIMHSWSIEREDNVITIGIERQRTPNPQDSDKPSGGRFDLTVQYRLESASDETTTITSPIPSTIAASTSATAATSDVDLGTQSLSSKKIGPPGRWTLVRHAVFPNKPDLQTFLYDTPPNRGADEHDYYHLPAQTPPPSSLSMLARYIQITAFKSNIIDAEFQVAYGRKVRYDGVLARIRPTWDYALKGAKTQKEKRLRGEYNVPRSESSPDKTTHRSDRAGRPGVGDSVGYLAGYVPTTEGGRDLPGFVVRDDETVEVESEAVIQQGVVGGAEEGEGRRTKRVKRERDEDVSGSEYSDDENSE